jgi:hypothetical protein
MSYLLVVDETVSVGVGFLLNPTQPLSVTADTHDDEINTMRTLSISSTSSLVSFSPRVVNTCLSSDAKIQHRIR